MDISETSNSSYLRFRWKRLLGSSVMQSSSMPCGFTSPSFKGWTRGLSEKANVNLSGMTSLSVGESLPARMRDVEDHLIGAGPLHFKVAVAPGGRVDERRSPLVLHDRQASGQRRTNLFGVEDGSFAVNAEALRQRGEIGGGSLQADSDSNVVQGALPHLGDRELVSDVLVVRPVVEHHSQPRNLVMVG